jgi:hypothetical protein
MIQINDYHLKLSRQFIDDRQYFRCFELPYCAQVQREVTAFWPLTPLIRVLLEKLTVAYLIITVFTPNPMLNQMNLVHSFTLHFPQIHCNIIIPYVPASANEHIYLRKFSFHAVPVSCWPWSQFHFLIVTGVYETNEATMQRGRQAGRAWCLGL